MFFLITEQVMITNGFPSDGRRIVTSPYGGYIFPGSTINNMHISVSQWQTSDPQAPPPPVTYAYRAMQYRSVLVDP